MKQLHAHMLKIFSTGISVDRVENNFKELLCCLPQIHAPGLSYENLFRIIIMRFIDAYDFDVRAIKKSCVHIVNKDGRIIPFETMNMFYRDDKEEYVRQFNRKHYHLTKKYLHEKLEVVLIKLPLLIAALIVFIGVICGAVNGADGFGFALV